MAVVAHDGGTRVGDRVTLYKWVLSNGDTGTPIQTAAGADKTVQVYGTFGVGGTVDIEGAMLTGQEVSLNDPQGNPLALTTNKVEAVLENPLLIRPNCSAGDGTTSLTCALLVRTSKV